MALIAATTRRPAGAGSHDGEIVNAAVCYEGGYLMQGGPSHATATTTGRIQPYNDEVGSIPFGRCQKGGTGATAANPIPRATSDLEAHILKAVAVTGVTALTDVGKVVYMTDDNTLTLTRPTYGLPVGHIIAWRATTSCDVLFWGVIGTDILALAGAAQERWLLAVVTGIAAAGADVATGIVAPYHGKINAVYGIVSAALVGAGADLSYNLEIGGTNVTGGVVQVLLADATGTKKAGTAVTAANVFHEGDLIDVEVAVATASTGGLVMIFAEVERLLGT
jgi:hypothetical protein